MEIQENAEDKKTPEYKWVPVINDYCIGCGACVKACPHLCLKPVWDYATLVRPDTCTSGGDCIPVCEDDAIHMKWVKIEEGDREVGEWCNDPPEPPPPPRKSLLQRIVWLFSGS